MHEVSKEKIKLILSVVIFGTIGVVRSFIPCPSGMIACVRGFVGCAFLLVTVFVTGKKPDLPAIKRNLPLLCLSGGLIGANWVCLFEAYRYTSVSTATMCYYMAPVFVVFIARPVLKEPLTPKKLLCSAIALAGMALVSGIVGGADFSAAGVAFGLAAALMYAWVIILNKLLKDISALDRTIVQLLAAGAAVLPYALFAEDTSSVSITPSVIALLLTAGIVHTGAAYALYFGAIEKVPAQTAALFSYIDPAVAVVLSALVLGEKLSAVTVVGVLLVLGAAAAGEVSLKKTPQAAEAEKPFSGIFSKRAGK